MDGNGYALPGLPDGYEAVGLRPMRIGEEIWDEVGGIVTAKVNGTTPRLIVRKIWQWPDWIKPGHWIAMDRNGGWHLHAVRPRILDGAWRGAMYLAMVRVNWTPPPCSNWRLSAMQKPVEDCDG